MVYKAEVMAEGTNTRFVVTSRTLEAAALYDWYVARGASETWIKDFKNAIQADRLSCHRFWANQFRLLLHAAAYWLLDALRSKLVAAGAERMQLDTLRLRLIKIGGRVRELLHARQAASRRKPPWATPVAGSRHHADTLMNNPG